MVGDHDALYACINVRVPRFQPRFTLIRNEKELDENAFKEDFSLLPLDVVYGLELPDDMVHALNSLMKDCLDRHAPLRRIKVTCPPTPWLQTEEIRQLQKDRDQLRAEVHKNGGETSWAAFRDVRNKIKSVVGKARRSFLAIALSSKRPKEVWKVIHRVLHPSPKPIREDPEKLNRYFISTATRTLGTKPDSTHDLLDLVRSFPDQADEFSTFALRNVSRGEVLKEISRLRSDCSTGVDQIPVKFVKLASDYLSGPLTYIINSCINTTSFPKTWKTARVSPIPKVDNPVSEKDYRPVSILPSLSKIFERFVLNQILVFIEKQALVASSISGYRRGHSTTTVLMGIRDDIIRAMKKGEVTLMVCTDYSEAFDTIQFRLFLRNYTKWDFQNHSSCGY